MAKSTTETTFLNLLQCWQDLQLTIKKIVNNELKHTS